MGVSTDAILFYGYCWTEPTELFPEGKGEWEEIIAKRRGEQNPWDSAPTDLFERQPKEAYGQREVGVKSWTDAHRAELDAWHSKLKSIREEFGVKVDFHCSTDYAMPLIAAWKKIANRGDPENVTETSLRPNLDWDAKLNRFLQELDIQKPHDSPQWWLVSYWG